MKSCENRRTWKKVIIKQTTKQPKFIITNRRKQKWHKQEKRSCEDQLKMAWASWTLPLLCAFFFPPSRMLFWFLLIFIQSSKSLSLFFSTQIILEQNLWPEPHSLGSKLMWLHYGCCSPLLTRTQILLQEL